MEKNLVKNIEYIGIEPEEIDPGAFVLRADSVWPKGLRAVVLGPGESANVLVGLSIKVPSGVTVEFVDSPESPLRVTGNIRAISSTAKPGESGGFTTSDPSGIIGGIGITLTNCSESPRALFSGDKIAGMILSDRGGSGFRLVEVEEFGDSERPGNGYGETNG